VSTLLIYYSQILTTTETDPKIRIRLEIEIEIRLERLDFNQSKQSPLK